MVSIDSGMFSSLLLSCYIAVTSACTKKKKIEPHKLWQSIKGRHILF